MGQIRRDVCRKRRPQLLSCAQPSPGKACLPRISWPCQAPTLCALPMPWLSCETQHVRGTASLLVCSCEQRAVLVHHLVAASPAHTAICWLPPDSPCDGAVRVQLGGKGFGDALTFDSAYYQSLLKKPWESKDAMAQMIGLPSDHVLPDDQECRPIIERFASDQAAFFVAFEDAFLKMTSSGAVWA